jgi:hypothetical protein
MPSNDESSGRCEHINLVKQTGPMDGGAASTRYRCGVALGLREVLEHLEWCMVQDGWEDYCPMCGRNKSEGHNSVCRLAEVLANTEGCSAFFVVAPHEIGVCSRF